MAVSDYSSTPANNTTISGISLAEGWSAASVNNAFRQLMADVKVMYDDLPDEAALVTKTGGVFTGNPTFSGRGGYLHHNSSSNTGGRIFIQASGGATPSGMANGDILIEY